MLILTRRPGESLYLGENIRITVLGMQGKQVKLGLEVPGDTTVYREEVYKRVIEESRLRGGEAIDMNEWRTNE